MATLSNYRNTPSWMDYGRGMYNTYQRYNPMVNQARKLYSKYGAGAKKVVRRSPSVSSRPYRSRNKVGFPVGSAETKRTESATIHNLNTNSRTLNSFEVTKVSRGASNQIELRQRDLINLSGVRLNFESRSFSQYPQNVRMALISPKFGKTVDSDDFFRGYGDKRGNNFSATSLDSMSFHDRPINRDLYEVLYETKFLIAEMDSDPLDTWRSGDNKSYRSMLKYVPVNRQIRYDGNLATDCVNPIFLVFWHDKLMTAAGTAVAPASTQTSYKAVLVWREP